MTDKFDLSGKVAVVTGGSKGIGYQIVKEYAEAGANVVIASRNMNKCEEMAHEISAIGVKALPVKCNVGNLEDINTMFSIVKKEFNKLDILVNNAGVYQTKPDIKVTENDWDAIFDINLKGLFFCAQNAAKLMHEHNGGRIINMASATGVKPLKRMSPYTTSKAAVIHLTRSLASEWARYNIQVNSIAPGIIHTDINSDELGNKELAAKTLKRIPLRRYGTPADISSMALYLASDAASYVTGQTFYVDGGFLAE